MRFGCKFLEKWEVIELITVAQGFHPDVWADPEFEGALCSTAQPPGSSLDPSPGAAQGSG